MKIELSHDLLAKKIHEKASDEDKMLLRIRKFVQDRFHYFSENNALLSLKDISYITPYLDKISLEPHETRFIRRSKDRLWIITGTTVFSILGVIALIFYFIHRTDKIELKNQEVLAAQLARYEQISKHAEELSSALTASREGLDATKEELHLALLALQERNDTLVNSYATYKVTKNHSVEKLEKDLKVAQSAKLSELAASASNKNKAYSFRLASKAWHLNPENKQAINTLYKVADRSRSKTYSKQPCSTIIKKYTPKWGKLSDKEVDAIFNPQNNVTAEDDVAQQVQQTIDAPPPPTTSPTPVKNQMQEVRKKIQIEREQIQQQVQKINLEQQKIRKKIQQQK
ncbi:MAG: hypothetical protein AB8E82_12400 [Aureispira sp.]